MRTAIVRITFVLAGFLAIHTARAESDFASQVTVKPLPVAKAKFHRYEHLRCGSVKTPAGWEVQDWAVSIYNPNDKPIKLTWKLIADDPNFQYNNKKMGTRTKTIMLRPDDGITENLMCNGKQNGFPILLGSHWTGATEFSSDAPFYVYILPHTPLVRGADPSKAYFKSWDLWANEVLSNWDEQRREWIFPYTNYWHNYPDWPDGWHSGLVLVNRSGKTIYFRVDHKSYFYGTRSSLVEPMRTIRYATDRAVVPVKPGQKTEIYLEQLFGWQEDFESFMEGRLCVTPSFKNPPSFAVYPPSSEKDATIDPARAESEVRLYILRGSCTIPALKPRQAAALSDDAGVVVDENAKK